VSIVDDAYGFAFVFCHKIFASWRNDKLYSLYLLTFRQKVSKTVPHRQWRNKRFEPGGKT